MLSSEQTVAAQDAAQHLVVVAGPGTGKTFTLAHRIAHQLAAGRLPHKLLALSFTNEACNALKQHLSRIVGPEVAGQIHVFTFHSFCRHLLQQTPSVANVQHDFSIADEYDSATILWGSRLSLNQLRAQTRDQLGAQPSYRRYLNILQSLNMVDYRSLLDYGLELCSEIEYDHVFVDEFQDTAQTQVDILKKLVKKGTRTSVFGDPNQAIYGFLNQNFTAFDSWKAFILPKTCYLTTNFRSTQALVEFSDSYRWAAPQQASPMAPTQLRENKESIPATLEACATEVDAARALVDCTQKLLRLYKPQDVAILTYTNAKLARVLDILKKAKIPVQGPLSRALVEQPNPQAVYALLKYAAMPRNIYLLRILDKTERLMSSTIRQRLQHQTNDFVLPLLDKFGDNLRPTPKIDQLKRFAKTVLRAVQELNVASDGSQVQQAIVRFLDEVPGLKNDVNVARLLNQLKWLVDARPEVTAVLPFLLEKIHEVHDDQNAVNVRTIHSAKGMEFKAVIMPFIQDHAWQVGRNHSNTLYVGITRASHRLHLVSTGPTVFAQSPHLRILKSNIPLQFTTMARQFPKLFSPLVFKRLRS